MNPESRFGGRITYASIPVERVDWAPFDIVGLDLYRSADVAAQFADGVRTLTSQGKPVAITEFGCTTYRGAADHAGHDPSFSMIVWGDDARPIGLKGEYVRDEDEQATYLREVLDVFEAEGVDSAFVNTFARYDLPHSSDPRQDFDMASFGVVKVLDGSSDPGFRRYRDMPWEPKAAFTALAKIYGR